MRTVSAVALLLLGSCLMTDAAFAAPRSTLTKRETIAPRIESLTFPCQTFAAEKRFCVVLPQGYTANHDDWPVLLLLHGRGRNERSLIDDKATRAVLLAATFVTVLPDGDDGWYIDSPMHPADRYETYLGEVMRVAEDAYRLSSHAGKRAICGWSMGGYGAMRYAQSHPEQFSLVAPIIGLLDFPRDGLPAGQSYRVPANRFGNDPAVWKQFNPIAHVEKVREMSILLITADKAFDRTMNENFHKRLLREQIPHRWLMLHGGHTFAVVQRALPLVVEYAQDVFAKTSANLKHR